jgi:uncharacterized membrane protein
VTTDQLAPLEHKLGRLLVAGVFASAAFLVAGLLLWLRDSTGSAAAWLLNAGLVTLMATPILRVVVSVTEYVRLRQWFFVAVTIAVLAELTVTVWAALYRISRSP